MVYRDEKINYIYKRIDSIVREKADKLSYKITTISKKAKEQTDNLILGYIKENATEVIKTLIKREGIYISYDSTCTFEKRIPLSDLFESKNLLKDIEEINEKRLIDISRITRDIEIIKVKANVLKNKAILSDDVPQDMIELLEEFEKEVLE